MEEVNQLTIERAMNGFQVYLKDFKYAGTVRPVPFVFESMETLLKFVETQLNKK